MIVGEGGETFFEHGETAISNANGVVILIAKEHASLCHSVRLWPAGAWA